MTGSRVHKRIATRTLVLGAGLLCATGGPAHALPPIQSQWVFAAGTRGLAWTEDFSGISGIGFGLSTVREDYGRVDLQFTYAYSPLETISDLNSRIDGGVNIFSFGIDYNAFTTPEHTFIGQYFTAGLAYNNMAWKYTEPVEIEDTRVSRDALSGAELYVGVGLNFAQFEWLRLGLELTPGYIIWLGGSNRGFERESFDRFYNLKLSARAAIRIR